MRQPVHKRRGIQSFNIHKLSDTNGKEIFQTDFQKKRGKEIFQTVSFIKCTHLVIPTALPPITSLGGIRMPITLPRGTSTRRRTLDRAVKRIAKLSEAHDGSRSGKGFWRIKIILVIYAFCVHVLRKWFCPACLLHYDEGFLSYHFA